MLHLHDIESGYGAGQVIFGVSLSVPAGRVVSLMGRNGMGKTTTIRTIMGQLPLTAGRISRFGNDQPDQLPFQIARQGIGLVPEGRQIFSNLDVTENLKTFYRPPRDDGGSHWHYERVLDLFPRIAERRDHAGNHLSGGEQQMLAIGRGMMAEPRLMILDEPSLGLSPLLVEEMFGLIQNLNKTGLSFFLVEQNVMQSLEIANRAYVIENGKIVLSGNTDALLSDPELKKSYLGV